MRVACPPKPNCASTPKGFEPLRAEPNGFLVHLLSHSDTVSSAGTCSPYLSSHRKAHTFLFTLKTKRKQMAISGFEGVLQLDQQGKAFGSMEFKTGIQTEAARPRGREAARPRGCEASQRGGAARRPISIEARPMGSRLFTQKATSHNRFAVGNSLQASCPSRNSAMDDSIGGS